MKFTKMHGCGNDFVVVDGIKNNINFNQEQIAFLCSQHFGIGSEGLLVALPSKIADFQMKMFNVDGTEAEMCGNGIRCISRFAFENGIVNKKNMSVETKAGIKYIELVSTENDYQVKVNMGRAEFLENPAKEYNLHCVSVGNPHAVMIVNDVKNFPVCDLGPKIENHKAFPNRTNVEFAQVIDRKNVRLRIWERGCGETLACGTGSTATFAILNKLNLIDKVCNIQLNGGLLKFEMVDNEIFMTGNAVRVFDGENNL